MSTPVVSTPGATVIVATRDGDSVTVGRVGITVIVEPVAADAGDVVAVLPGIAPVGAGPAVAETGGAGDGVILGDPSASEAPPAEPVAASPDTAVGV